MLIINHSLIRKNHLFRMHIECSAKSGLLRKFPTRYHWIYILAFFLLSSCMKDIKELSGIEMEGNWTPGVAIPLLNTDFTISDILKSQNADSLFKQDEEGFMTIVYESGLFKAYPANFIRVPSQKLSFSPLSVSGIPSDSASFPLDIDLGDSKDFNIFTFNQAEIKYVNLKEGVLALSFDIDFRKDGYVVIEMPSLKKDGKIFRDSILFNNTSFNPITVTDTVQLTGYILDLTNNNSTTNVVPVNFRMRLNGSNTYIHKTDRVKPSVEFSGLRFSYIEGYLGKYDLNYPQSSMEISLFKSVETARLFFENPRLDILMYNSTGLPIEIDSFSLATMAKDSSTVPMSGLIISHSYPINYPSISEIGQTKFTGIYANKGNSNIDQMISILPQYLLHDFRLFVNPGNKTYDNFATDTSYVQLGLNLEFPLYGHTKDWTMKVNTPFETGDITYIKEIEFNLMISNEFPIEGTMQVYFLDENKNILDSLIDAKKPVIPSGIAGGSGKTIIPGYTLTKILYPYDRIQNIQNSKEFELVFTLATSEQGAYSVKFYSSYFINFSFSMRVKAEPPVL